MGTIKKTRETIRTIGGLSLIAFIAVAIRYLMLVNPDPKPKDLNLIWLFGTIVVVWAMIELVIMWIQHIQVKKAERVQEQRKGRMQNAEQRYKNEEANRIYHKSIANASRLLKPALHQFAKKHRLPISEVTNCIDHIVLYNPEIFVKKTIMVISAGNYQWRRCNEMTCFKMVAVEVRDKTVLITYQANYHKEQTESFNRND